MAQKHELEGKITVRAEAEGVKKTAASADDLAKKISKLDKAFQENIETQDHTRRSLQKLTDAGEQAGAEWSTLHKDLDRLGSTMERQEQAAKEYAEAMEETEDATEKQVVASKKLETETKELTEATEKRNEEIREGREAFDVSKKAIQQSEIALERLNEEQKDTTVQAKSSSQAIIQEATMLKRLKSEAAPATVQIKAASAAQLQLATATAKAKLETRFMGVEVGKLKESLGTALSIGGVMGLALAGVNLLRDGFNRAKEAAIEFQKASTKSFMDLQEEVARSKAQIPDLIQSQEKLYSTAVKTAREVGRAPLETQTAIRKAMNLGLEYDDALTAVRLSTEAARVANADMTDTLITGMSTVNAYGEGVYTLGEVLDQYAYVTQNSNLETQDLISGMAKIISPAAEAGVGLEEVASAMIVMNRQGDDFTEIADLLGNTLTQIAVRGTVLGQAFEDAAGMGFREFTAAGGTLVEGLQLIEKHADKTEQSISELVQGNSKFYRDMLAGRGVLELTGRHTKELVEAYNGATRATGTLDKQTAQFTDTLYLANEMMESAKEQAWALEGSLTQGLAKAWVELKTNIYDSISETTKALAIFNLIDAAAEGTELGMSPLIHLVQDYDFWTGEATRSIEDQEVAARTITEALEKNKDLTFEELDIMVQVALMKKAEAEIEKSINETQKDQLDTLIARQAGYEDLIDSTLVYDRSLGPIGQKEREITEYQEKLAAHSEQVAKWAESRAKWEAINAKWLLEQRMQLGAAYNTSKGLIDNISGLQGQLADATATDEITTLEQQLIDAGDALDKHYRQNVIDAMIANDGYNESIVDLAIEMGLITEEAGLLQKEFVRITTEGQKLAEMEGFKNLNFEEQAIAAQALADGIANTAKEAFALVDPEAWKEGLSQGELRFEESFAITPTVVMEEEDQTRLDVLEEQLTLITEKEWQAKVDARTSAADAALAALEIHLDQVVQDRSMIVTVHTVYQDPGQGGGYAGGGSFTVPPGYNSDNYMIGVSSGEDVTIVAEGQSSARGTDGVSVSMVNHFAAGVYDQQKVVQGTRDGLYRALEEIGLVE